MKILTGFLESPKRTVLACCILVGMFTYLWRFIYPVLGYVITMLAIKFAAWLRPDVPGGSVESWLLSFPIAILINVSLFAVPLWPLFVIFRSRVSNRVMSVLVVGWFVSYLLLYIIFPLNERL